jgi:hypothetical protein
VETLQPRVEIDSLTSTEDQVFADWVPDEGPAQGVGALR